MPLPIACVYTVESYVTLEKPIKDGNYIPFGIAMIASVLKSAGHNVELLVFTPDTPRLETLRPFIERFRPKLFCLTAVSTQFPLVCNIAAAVKNLDPTIFVALGGPHASLMPEEAIASPCIDAVCVGEGDTAIVDLATQILDGRQPTGIHNFWFKVPGTEAIEKNAPVPFLRDLDSLPFIDRNLWRPWIQEPEREPAVLIGRGCPFSCAYCSNHVLRKLAGGVYVRFRSTDNVIAEIEQITLDHKVTDVYLEVETISTNVEYALQLCQALSQFNDRRKININFKVNISVTHKLASDIDLINRLFEKFNRANIVTINIGLESGSERMRKEVLRRPHYSNEDFITLCSYARKYNIKINIYVMMGLPDESIEDFKETLRIVRLCEPNEILLSIYYPYPGTDLYRLAQEKNLFDSQTIGHTYERKRAYLNLPGFPKWRIIQGYIFFKFNIYKGKRSLMRRIYYIIRAAMEMNQKIDKAFIYLSRSNRIGQALMQKNKMDF